MLTKKNSAVTKVAVAAFLVITLSLLVASISIAIVKYIFISVLHFPVINHGGYRSTFDDILMLAFANILTGYFLYLLLQYIFRAKSRGLQACIAAICNPAVFLILSYSTFGVDWGSPPTLLYVFLVITAGALIPYLTSYMLKKHSVD